MSRIGKQAITIPEKVEVTLDGQKVLVKGPKGELSLEVKPSIKVELNEGKITFTPKDELKQTKAFHGLFRSLVANMVEGVEKGFQKELEISGVGYKARVQGDKVFVAVGYTHQVEYKIPEGIEVKAPEEVKIMVSGIDKQLVGKVAAEIRAIKPCEPYKGKGIKYVGEKIIRKAGKAAKAIGSA